MADTFTSDTDPRDWRGVPIVVEALVIYGAPVGRSIAMVEARVVGFTKSMRVNVRPVRRAYGSSAEYGWDAKDVVHVGQDRLTVVDTLPPPLMPTEDEKRTAYQARRARELAAENTHAMRSRVEGDRYDDTWNWDDLCDRCGVKRRQVGEKACPS